MGFILVPGKVPGVNAAIPVSAAAGMPTPQLVQHVSSSSQPAGLGETGNAFKFNLPNATKAGNCLKLTISYPNANTITSIVDTVNGTWPSVIAAADSGAGNYILATYILPNAAAGLAFFTVTLNAACQPFQYTLSEWCNVATANPVNGSTSATSIVGPSLAAGSFAPTVNNDANGGNLIVSDFALAQPAGGGNPTNWDTSSGPFTLLDGDIAWQRRAGNNGFPHASMAYVQTSQASINPGITATGDTTDAYNCVAVALKAANAGSPRPSSGIYITKIIHQTSDSPPANSTWKLRFPSTGNLRVLTTNSRQGFELNITGITDSDGNTWTYVTPLNTEPQCWYAANQSANPNLLVTLAISGTPATSSIFLWDIQGAAASPLGAVAGRTTTDVSNITSLNDAPDITPTASNSLMIGLLTDGAGPVTGFNTGAPPATFDAILYTGQTDGSLFDNSDGYAHLYNTSTNPQTWNWIFVAKPSNGVAGLAVEFKAA